MTKIKRNTFIFPQIVIKKNFFIIINNNKNAAQCYIY